MKQDSSQINKEIKKHVRNYLKAKDALAEIFDRQFLSDIDNMEHKWFFDGDELTWEEDGEEYSEEARLVSEVGRYKLFLVYWCTGDKGYLLVDTSKEMQE